MIMRAIITALAAVSILSVTAAKQASLLVVSVGEVGTGAFVKDAEVRLVEAKRSARTAWDGEARFSGLAAGRIHVQVRAIGYAPGDIDVQVSGDSSAVHFELERSSVALDTVRVSEATTVRPMLQEFETRRKQNIGRFLTDSMLREDRTQSLQYLLAARFPGIQAHEHGIRSMQPSGLGADSECPVLIYMDGFKITDVDKGPNISPDAQRLAGGGSRGGGGGGGGAAKSPKREITPLDNIRPDSLIGVEYYSRTSAPVQYKPLGNYCKVILLWTRR
jgi:hypothetical protein